jgi:hypothetical protein
MVSWRTLKSKGILFRSVQKPNASSPWAFLTLRTNNEFVVATHAVFAVSSPTSGPSLWGLSFPA